MALLLWFCGIPSQEVLRLLDALFPGFMCLSHQYLSISIRPHLLRVHYSPHLRYWRQLLQEVPGIALLCYAIPAPKSPITWVAR